MSRRRLVGLGVALIALGAWLAHYAQPSNQESSSVLSAFGRSMGGLRVLVENALYLRAERLRREGRPYDAVALYQTLVELDPASDAATTHLVDVQAGVMLEDVPSSDGRFQLWRDVLSRVEDAIRRHPTSARLEWRAAELLLSHYLVDDELNRRIDAAYPRRDDLAFDHLRRAVMLADELPRRGRLPLHQYVCHAPVVAMRALKRDDNRRFNEVLASMKHVHTLRAEGLGELLWGRGPPDADLPIGWDDEDLIPMRDVLAASITALDALKRGPLEPARAAVGHYAETVGPCLAVNLMRDRLEQIAK